jgi:1-pyrroline-5-carboxylate dehydrogenase
MSVQPFNVPKASNEPVKTYAPGTPERAEIKSEIARVYSQVEDIRMVIGGKFIRTDKVVDVFPPHNNSHLIGRYHNGGHGEVNMAIEAALKAKKDWAALSWEHRASIFLKAASLLSGPYRAKVNAATMTGQSKTVHQSEIDAACELIDFLRFNVQYMQEIYLNQPFSPAHTWNRVENRPLEGFVFALTPFNFTSIAGNLPTAPAIMGNTVVWKASKTQVYSARVLMEVFMEAGLPDGVINLVFVSGPVAGDVILNHPDFAGIHYTGSTEVFQGIWRKTGENIHKYRTYPRLVGETGGKDFVIAHSSANVQQLVTALTRGAFEYQGQKCSAASRAYLPASLWPEIRSAMEKDLKSIKMGPPEDFRNFMCAVIDESSFDMLAGHIDQARQSKEAEVIIGGGYDKSTGYYIEPTVIQAYDPKYVTMVEELFGPVLTVYIYDDNKWDETLELLDGTSTYALTGSLFARDRYIIESAGRKLTHAAGNYYINDKPTGAIVGQQPFGGARASGTNDKAGSYLNLLRWVSPRTIKERFIPPADYRYPYMLEE